ncbi:MAG: hypothetical protein PWP23_554 [Candidatus Sumerlaeota bacterium]|nr:hypothetical protein [Candidatus Sumerlaeota bacterium]
MTKADSTPKKLSGGEPSFWDERYRRPGYTYGLAPNEFLVSSLATYEVARGPALCIAEGEGRNAVHLALLGFRPLAVDHSPVGLAKASSLANEKGVAIETRCTDLAHFPFSPSAHTLAISIWCHLPPALRRKVHQGVAATLRPGGLYILESYHPDNIGRGTGGPQVPELCVTAADLRSDLPGLEILHLAEAEREVSEGTCHAGLAAVTQLVARKNGLRD